MKLHDVFPLAELRLRYSRSLTVEQLGNDSLNQAADKEPALMWGLGLHAWHRMLQSEEFCHFDENAMASYINGPVVGFLGMLEIVANPLVYDFSYTVCRNEEGVVVGRSIVADLCPNDLHIVDVYFQNPERPLAHEERKDADQEYTGFGLLGVLLKNADVFAEENGNRIITLVAASKNRVKLFARYGYHPSRDEKGRLAREMLKAVSTKKQ